MTGTLTLRVTDRVGLPLSWLTLKTVVYGSSGSGKTTFGSVVCEEVHRVGQRFVVIDPKGDYWGLKAAADGHREGLPVVVFGGDHADLPLTATSGRLIASVVVGMAESVIVDLEHLRKGAQLRFVADFAEALYELNRQTLLVVVDEAHRFAPQNVRDAQRNDGYATRCLGAIEDIVKLGRKHGLGIALLTQRGAGLNKECSELCDMLVAFRTPGVLDQARIKEWLGTNATADQSRTAIEVLSGLDTGTAVFASNHPKLRLFEIVAARRRWTFDSAATPEPGETPVTPDRLAAADIERLRGQLSEQQDELDAADPSKLKARVADLEKQLAVARKKADVPANVQPPPEPIEVEVVPPAVRRAFAQALARSEKAAAAVEAGMDALASAVDARRTDFAAVAALVTGDLHSVEHLLGDPVPARTGGNSTRARPADQPTRAEPVGNSLPSAPVHDLAPVSNGDGTHRLVGVTDAEQRILDAVGWADQLGLCPIDRGQLALLAGASGSSGAYKGNLAALLRDGLVCYPMPGTVGPTDLTHQIAQAGEQPIRTSADLQEALCRRLPEAQARLVRALIRVYPRALTREELAMAAGVSATSGAFKGDVAALKTLGLADYPAKGLVVATDRLFLLGR